MAAPKEIHRFASLDALNGERAQNISPTSASVTKARHLDSPRNQSGDSNSSIDSINSTLYTSNEYAARLPRSEAKAPRSYLEDSRIRSPPSSEGNPRDNSYSFAYKYKPESFSMNKVSKSLDTVGTETIIIQPMKGYEAQQIEKIFEDPFEIKVLKQISDKFVTIHYIEFFEGLKLIKSLSANTFSEMLLKLIIKKLDKLEIDFINDKALYRLHSISESARSTFINGITCIKSIETAKDQNLDIRFMDLVSTEVVDFISKTLYTKYVSMKSSKKPPPTSSKSEDQTIQKLVKVLDSEPECEKMIEILSKQHCLENLFYYQRQKEVCAFAIVAKNTLQVQALDSMMRQIFKDFMVPNSPYELNIPSKLRIAFSDSIKNRRPQVGILDPITEEVLNMMLQNSFPFYLKLHRE